MSDQSETPPAGESGHAAETGRIEEVRKAAYGEVPPFFGMTDGPPPEIPAEMPPIMASPPADPPPAPVEAPSPSE